MDSTLTRIWEHRYVAGIMGLLGAILQEAYGGLPLRAVATLFLFLAIDFAFGLGIAAWTKTVESRPLFRLFKKIGLYAAVLLVLNLLVKSDPAWERAGQMLLTAAMGVALTGEAISILEKLAEISKRTGIEMPIIGTLLNRLKVKQPDTPAA